jgi:hypothetical protein
MPPLARFPDCIDSDRPHKMAAACPTGTCPARQVVTSDGRCASHQGNPEAVAVIVGPVRAGSVPCREAAGIGGTSGHDGFGRTAGQRRSTAPTSGGRAGGSGFESPHPPAARPPGSCQRGGGGHRGRNSPYGQGGANSAAGYPASSSTAVPQRAIHSSPERSRTDNHGQPRSRLDLRRSPSSQVTAAPDLALGARSRVARLCRWRQGPPVIRTDHLAWKSLRVSLLFTRPTLPGIGCAVDPRPGQTLRPWKAGTAITGQTRGEETGTLAAA